MRVPRIRPNGTVIGHSDLGRLEGQEVEFITHEHEGGDVVSVDMRYREQSGFGKSFTKGFGRLWDDGPLYLCLGVRVELLARDYLRVSWRLPFYVLWMLAARLETVALIVAVGLGLVEHEPGYELRWSLRRHWPVRTWCDTHVDWHGTVVERIWGSHYMMGAGWAEGLVYYGHDPVTVSLRAWWHHLVHCIGRVPDALRG